MKVTYIVDHGTPETSNHTHSLVAVHHGGQWETAPRTQRFDLARKLALPPIPTRPLITPGNCLSWGFILLTIPTGIIFAGLTYAAGMGNYHQQALTFFGSLAFAIAVILLITYLVSFKAGRAKYSAEKPKWDRAWRIWNRLYFCLRDNKIYDPETGEVFDVLALNHHIFSK